MGLRLITEEELLTFDGPGFKVHYRRLPNKRRAQIIDRNTKRGGVTNFTQATIEMLEYSVKGWEGVYERGEDGKRKDIPFEPSKISMIPDLVQSDLVEVIGENADREGDDLGNLPNTSGNKETTEA